MSDNSPSTESNRHDRISRRQLLCATATGALVTASGCVSGSPGGDESEGFPPDGTTTYGRSVTLGDGEVTPFTTATTDGVPEYHGVEFDRDVVTGQLSDADELATDRTSDDPTHDDKYGPAGEALLVHRRESLQFFVDFPDAGDTPITFLGLNWNPNGHPGGGGAWAAPHFDVHFHLHSPDRIDAIEGPSPPPYDDIPAEKIPAGYDRSPPEAAAERYITDMGEHLAPSDAPELPGNPESFTNTLIQGFVGVDGEPELAFVEPMLTRELLRGFEGTETYEVPQPAAYPHDSHHPTAYSLRADPTDGTVTVAIQGFESV